MKKKIQTLNAIIWITSLTVVSAAELKEEFNSPPDASRSGVYWYFMDGNMDRDMMEVDLESMHKAGLRKALFLVVNIGVPTSGEHGDLCPRIRQFQAKETGHAAVGRWKGIQYFPPVADPRRFGLP